LNVLDNMVRNYNHRSHRSLKGLSPANVNKLNEALLWKTIYVDVIKSKVWNKKTTKNQPKRFKVKVGNMSEFQASDVFQKDYEQKLTEEVFLVSRRYLRQGIPIYKLMDYGKDQIEGTLYESELQKSKQGQG